jgi:hypothetical protein
MLLSFSTSAQQDLIGKINDSLHKDPFLNTVEQSLDLFYKDYVKDTDLDSLQKHSNLLHKRL